MIDRASVLGTAQMVPGKVLLQQGTELLSHWSLGQCAFIRHYGVDSEVEYKRQQQALGRVMQHAHIGFRDPAKTVRACDEVYTRCAEKNVRVDRFGLCLDWSMGYPLELRRKVGASGTGIMLDSVEECIALTEKTPVAPHFGDFMLGFPGSLENTQWALAAGATALGNLGQYFTFRLPNWDDDVETTQATVRALGLIAAQSQQVLVHSNIDDGFGAQFSDLACCLGAVLLERYIVEDLIGAKMAHCYGHHFSDPLTRMAFASALQKTEPYSGTMVFGATVTYKGDSAANFASLGNYLLVDILAQQRLASGHAINPVPVTENVRIPDIDEIVEAQTFAARLVEQGAGFGAMLDWESVEPVAEQIYRAGKTFCDNVLQGLAQGGFDVEDPAEMLLALRRIGARRLEKLYGPGYLDKHSPNGRKPVVTATTYVELAEEAQQITAGVDAEVRTELTQSDIKVLAATSDVHEHAKVLLTMCYQNLGVEVLDGGISTPVKVLARQAAKDGVDCIALSTYNGVALSYYRELRAQLNAQQLDIPVLIGGRLNQIASDSLNSLPEDVCEQLAEEGALVCLSVESSFAHLQAFAKRRAAAKECSA